MAVIERVEATTDIEVVQQLLDRDGGLIIEDLIEPETVNTLKRELAPLIQSRPADTSEFGGFQTKRVGALIARSRTTRELALNGVINKIAEAFLEPFCDSHQLHFTQAVSIGPGQKAQLLHRDRGVWGGYVPRSIETQLSTIWAISEFTEQNGATQLVPGSHKWHKDRVAEPHEIAIAEMKPGSVLVYTGSVIHGGGENTSENDVRTGVLLHYCPSWLRQEENQYLSCPPEIAKDLEPELRALMGYSKGGYFLGFYSDPNSDGTGLENVSPERMFGARTDEFALQAHSSDELFERTS